MARPSYRARGTRLQASTDGPSIRNVIRYMFERYWYDDIEDEGCKDEAVCLLCCVTCNRVIRTQNPSDAEAHFETCVRKPSAPTETTTFMCGPCNLSTKNFNHWKYFHVATQRHRARCDVLDLYTKTCWHCDTMMYDTEATIGAHALECSSVFNQHHRKHSMLQNSRDNVRVAPDMPTLSLFMAYLYGRMQSDDPEKTNSAGSRVRCAYYCAGCNAWEFALQKNGQPVHRFGREPSDRSHAALETFHCTTCRATFTCDESAYRWHLVSVEHLALERRASCDGTDDADVDAPDGVPRIVWRNFVRRVYTKGMDKGTLSIECRACRRYVAKPTSAASSDSAAVLAHAESCSGLRPVFFGDCEDDDDSCTYRTFWCVVCSVRANDEGAWARHVTSATHLMLCREMRYFAHYECTSIGCRSLYYGTFARVEQCHATDWRHRLRPVPVADLMRRVFEEQSQLLDGEPRMASCAPVTFFYRQDIGAFGRCDPSTGIVPHYCATCRIEFYCDESTYRQHTATVEHLLLQRFTNSRPSPPLIPSMIQPAAVGHDREPLPRRRAKDDDEDDVDEAYGRYVIARLKAIKDRDLKNNVKLAIDALFDLNVR